MEFLGYCPVRYTRTRGELFRLFRVHQDFTQVLAARFLAVDTNTIAAWKKNQATGLSSYQGTVAGMDARSFNPRITFPAINAELVMRRLCVST